MGNDGWEYEGMDDRSKVGKNIGGQQHDSDEQALTRVPEIRRIIAKLARREDR